MAKKLSPFEEAFKEARAEGKKTFTFNGKSYGTTTADDEQKRIDKMPARVADAPTEIQAGTRYVDRPRTPTPSTAKARSLVDQGRDVDIYKDVDKEAVLAAGLGLASLNPAVRIGRAAYTAARPVVGAALKKEFGEDGLFPTFNRAEDPRSSVYSTLKPENQAASRKYREAYDDRPGPMKKGGAVKKMASGGKVSGASSRGDGIAQRGRTKGRFV
jgi:hypothetical protein